MKDGIMKRNRFFCCPITEPIVVLEGGEAHHLSAVLRHGPGDEVELFDGRGVVAVGQVIKAKPKRVELDIVKQQVLTRSEKGEIVLAVSLAKGERFDWLIGKCTELGVDTIYPVLFERTVKQGKNPGLVSRWEKLTVAAAKQCERNFLPTITAPIPFDRLLEEMKGRSSRLLIGSLQDGAVSLVRLDWEPGQDVVAFVGPEGGMTDAEEEQLRQMGAIDVALTSTVLRTETAGLAFASILTVLRDQDQV